MIRFNDVNKIYNPNKNNEYHALKNVNLTIKDTGLVLLVGKSGSGKTTLLNLISGLDKISSGTLDISYKEPYASFLFQDAQLLEQYTVKENLLLAMNISNHKVDISTYIKKYELEGLLNHKANELSSGQKMRVAFVRAILCNRPILICDEPTGALDSINAKIMAEELINASKERLVIVASHDPELFIDSANQVIQIEDGIVKDHSKEEEEYPIKNYSNESKLPLKETIKLSFANIKKHKIRYILSLISFALAFSLLFCTLFTLLFKEDNAKYNIYKEYNLPNIIYYNQRYNEDEEAYSTDSFNEEECIQELKDNRKFIIDNNTILSFFQTGVKNIIFETKAVFMKNTCDYPMLYGKNSINNKEVIISQSDGINYARQLNIDVKDLLGYTIFDCKIVGIYKDYDIFYNHPGEGLTNHHIYMLEEDYNNHKCKNGVYLDFILGNSTNEMGFTIKLDDTLMDDEIILPINLKDSIQNSITLKCKSEEYNDSKSFKIIEYKEDTKEINNQITISNTIFLSKKNYEEYKKIYLNQYKFSMIGISNYRESDFEYISNNNYILESELEQSIYMTKINMQMIAIVEAIFAAMISVLTLILIINYSKNTIDESNREMGILLSMGVKRKKLPSIFIPDILFIFILSLMLSIPLGIFGFLMQSNVANNTSEFKFQYGYVSFLPFVIVIVSLLIVLFSILFIIFKRVFKKNTIDLIYHK